MHAVGAAREAKGKEPGMIFVRLFRVAWALAFALGLYLLACWATDTLITALH